MKLSQIARSLGVQQPAVRTTARIKGQQHNETRQLTAIDVFSVLTFYAIVKCKRCV